MSFDGSKSATSAETIVTFLDSYEELMPIDETPGIGPASKESLQGHGITTLQQLAGKYLSLVGIEATSDTTNQAFYDWFKTVAPKANAHTVTFAVAHLVDKFGIMRYED